MNKVYIVDTNILLEDEDAIGILRNGEENKIIIPYTVLEEIDKLKKNNRLRPQVMKVIQKLNEWKDEIEITNKPQKADNNPDNTILMEVKELQKHQDNIVFVTNDNLLRFKANKNGINSEEYESSKPFNRDYEVYSGFIEPGDDPVPNCFYWRDGELWHYTRKKEKIITENHKVWNVEPRNTYQNAAFELMLNPNINIVSLLSEPGLGKSYLSLATALHLVLQEKSYEKIYVIRRNNEIGEDLGYLPGDINEKIAPHFRAIQDLLFKLHDLRPANKLFKDPDDVNNGFNNKKIEFLPPNFMRGMNVDNAVVLIDEVTNFPRYEVRTILTRMGQNVKCFCTGDTRQIDNTHLNSENNGLNWIIKYLTGFENYGHITLKGRKSRGPITDIVRKSGL